MICTGIEWQITSTANVRTTGIDFIEFFIMVMQIIIYCVKVGIMMMNILNIGIDNQFNAIAG